MVKIPRAGQALETDNLDLDETPGHVGVYPPGRFHRRRPCRYGPSLQFLADHREKGDQTQ